ncbi:hypothetical protein GCM10011414_08840 [Croceivirga lutea]|uniref:PepSY domain-containing protein n=1 Tax=Croceivirga lutea TaxID=1775167 RepID=UPI00163B3985|nr:PepSY domain-containing protein [Croceivirga lutea]GGG41561.1 hypothetical protein GCM10011414_08840 [Croceivirga lutea]
MTISIWRYSHLVLALSSGLFLILAALTGVILAFEPLQSAIKPYHPVDLKEVSLAETIGVLQNQYDEVLTLKVDQDDFIIADIVTKQGDSKQVYVHPLTGEALGEPEEQHPIFKFSTNLHRSLFLKSIGRFFVGLISFLLCLIAFTGLLLIIKRQGGLAKLFSKVQKDYFELRYHVILGRWFLFPIILIAATGTYLSAEKFSLLPIALVTHTMAEPEVDVDERVKPSELAIFKTIKMADVRTVNFPFSPFPEDYFEVSLRKKELYVHQYTGDILSELPYPFTFLASKMSFRLHTGQGSILWSLVLLLASCSILFFIYSGFMMWRNRIKNSITKVEFTKDESTHIILYGSETGNTNGFVLALQKALIKNGKRVFIAPMNTYSTYKQAEKLFVLTSTYGEGEAPTNARRFLEKLHTINQPNKINYAVIGFGSLNYPKYCQFAKDVSHALKNHPSFNETTALTEINNQSHDAFINWVNQWNSKVGEELKVSSYLPKNKTGKQLEFEVSYHSEINTDNTFLIQLKPKKKIKFNSGDLLAYRPNNDDVPRFYSIAKCGNQILLSIKIHDFGICSRLFSRLNAGDTIEASIQKNTHFNFPAQAKSILCISNGTGIAPFLGLIDENKNKIPIQLFWGSRTKASYTIYKPFLMEPLTNGKLQKIHLAYSRESEKQYVQDLLLQQEEFIATALKNGTVIMICGSLAMQHKVLQVLEKATQTYLNESLATFEENEQLKTDCY